MVAREMDGAATQKLNRVRAALRIVGAGWIAFWAALALNELSGGRLWDGQSWIAPYVMWHDGGDAYLKMLIADNLVIGIFLFLSARDPLAHKLFIDFALAANGAHMLSMILMSVLDPHEHTKLLGDIPLGTVPTAILARLWFGLRSSLDDSSASRLRLPPRS
jgi:hypothetical protein